MVADSRPQPSQPQRSPIARFFIFLFKFILLIVVIAAGGALGWVGAEWISGNIALNDAQTREINKLQDVAIDQKELANRVDNMDSGMDFMAGQFDTLSDEADALSDEVSALSDAVAAQSELVAAQDAQIATLTEAQTNILNDLAAAQTDVEDLVPTTDGLRETLTASAESSSSVSNSIDAIEAQVSLLDQNLASIEENLASIEATVSMTPTVVVVEQDGSEEAGAPVAADVAPSAALDLTLIRLLGQIARAKIHLLEEDSASASAAIQRSIDLSSAAAEAYPDQAETIGGMAESLDTALESLESKPAASAIALDDAWNSLELLLIALSP